MKRFLVCLLVSVVLLALNVNNILLCIVSFDPLILTLTTLVAAGTVYILYKGLYHMVYHSRP